MRHPLRDGEHLMAGIQGNTFGRREVERKSRELSLSALEPDHRIRVAGLVVDEGKLLLLRHEHPGWKEGWWCPPGGKVEGEESIFECAEREVWEETNISISAAKIMYIQELLVPELSRRSMELFVLGCQPRGILQGKRVEESYKQEARYFSIDGLQRVIVYPEILKNEFWADVSDKYVGTKYLGLRKQQEE